MPSAPSTTSQIKERPILFSGPMVKAILSGQKTMTRRVMKLQPPADASGFWQGKDTNEWWFQGTDEETEKMTLFTGLMCPYGRRGERLWVRESALPDFPKEFSYYDWSWREVPEEYRTPEFVLYRASYPGPDKIKWHPSIHMPRWASRLLLEVTSVRVERLQDISEEDAKAEGVGFGFQMNAGWPDYTRIVNGVCELAHDSARASFATLWDSINGKGSWDSNPWVWCLTFRRLE